MAAGAWGAGLAPPHATKSNPSGRAQVCAAYVPPRRSQGWDDWIWDTWGWDTRACCHHLHPSSLQGAPCFLLWLLDDSGRLLAEKVWAPFWRGKRTEGHT